MSQPLVSILIVTHNAEAYIEATMASCLAQTHQSFEVLVLDNASSDTTVEKIQNLNDPRIKLTIAENNLGPYRGLNELLKKVQGEYIAIQDHDDLWLPSKLESQIDFLRERRDFTACGTLTYYFYEDRQLLVLPRKPIETSFVDHTSLLFRRAEVWYNPGRALPDEYFERKTLRQLGRLGCVQQGLTIHRVRADQKNLSTQRTRWNPRGAWEHWQLTGYRDLAGTSLFFLFSLLPAGFQWWLRRHVTLRRAEWITAKEFTSKHHLPLS